jgi:hypothetical protein
MLTDFMSMSHYLWEGDEEVTRRALDLSAGEHLSKIGDHERVYSRLVRAICSSVKRKRESLAFRKSSN